MHKKEINNPFGKRDNHMLVNPTSYPLPQNIENFDQNLNDFIQNLEDISS